MNPLTQGLTINNGAPQVNGSNVTTPTSNTQAIAGQGAISLGSTFPNLTPPPPTNPLTNTPPPTYASQVQNAPTTQQAPTGQTPTLSSYVGLASGNKVYTTPSGSTVTVDANGNIVSPANFNINTSGSIPSNALGTNSTMNDVMGQQSQYAQYVQSLYNATQLPQSYLDALKQYQQAQLNEQAHQVQGNYIGETTGFAAGATQRQIQTDELAKTAASNALNVEQARYQSNIEANKGLVSATAPTTIGAGASLVSPYSGQQIYSGLGGYQAIQGIQTVNNLAQTYPDAGILPTDSLQAATQKAAMAPSFQARNLITYTTPAGGTAIFNKLNTGLLSQGSDGTYTLVGGAAAAFGKANVDALTTQVNNYNNLQTSYNKANEILNTTQQFMRQYNLNDTNIPILNQIQNKLGSNTNYAGILAGYNADIQALRADYTQILARGGAVTDTVRTEANQLVPNDLSPVQLQQLAQQLNADGSSALTAQANQINQLQMQISGNSTSYSAPSSGSYINPAQATW